MNFSTASALRPTQSASAGSGKYIPYSQREYMPITWADCKPVVGFLLSCALVGLRFYPAVLLVLYLLVRAFRRDRYNFVLMSTLFIGSYGFIGKIFPFLTADIALIAGCVLFFMMRKPPLLKRTLWLIVIYVVIMFILASYSLESIWVQIRGMRCYWYIVWLMVPIACFAGRPFDLKVFFSKALVFAFVISVFYILDAFFFSGNILVPKTYLYDDIESTFWSPYMNIFSITPHRKYPNGMYFLALAALPLIRTYRLRWWQMLCLLGGLMATQTFTVICAYVAAVIIFQGSVFRFLKFCLAGVVLLVGVYFIDCFLPMRNVDSYPQSTLRIKSSVDQFIALAQFVDDEDLAEFGSGRIAQVLPKIDLVMSHHKELTGLGFLHSKKTTMSRYIIINEYYTDVSENEEVATAVEISGVQVFLCMGFIGLAVHTLFFLILYLFIRKLPHSLYYLCVLFICWIFGLGGFATLDNIEGLGLVSIAYAVVILANRNIIPGFRPVPES